MRVVIMGPPGAGKGTQSVLLAAALGVPHLSSGDMVRAAIAAGTPAGLAARACVDVGRLAPEEVILGIVSERLSRVDCADGFVLDGFPRQVSEASALDGMLSARGRRIDVVVHVDVPSHVVMARIASRALTSGRADDAGSAVLRRLAVYDGLTVPVLSRYEALGMLERVDGTMSVADVAEAVCDALARRGLDVTAEAPRP